MMEGNTDVRYSFASLIDSIGELFGGRMSFDNIMDADMPMLRSLVKVRLENLENRKTQGPDLVKFMNKFV